MSLVFEKIKKHGILDYVSAWYKKAADYIENTNIEAAFVSTNSSTKYKTKSFQIKDLENFF